MNHVVCIRYKQEVLFDTDGTPRPLRNAFGLLIYDAGLGQEHFVPLARWLSELQTTVPDVESAVRRLAQVMHPTVQRLVSVAVEQQGLYFNETWCPLAVWDATWQEAAEQAAGS
jgi:hypothetical protein